MVTWNMNTLCFFHNWRIFFAFGLRFDSDPCDQIECLTSHASVPTEYVLVVDLLYYSLKCWRVLGAGCLQYICESSANPLLLARHLSNDDKGSTYFSPLHQLPTRTEASTTWYAIERYVLVASVYASHVPVVLIHNKRLRNKNRIIIHATPPRNLWYRLRAVAVWSQVNWTVIVPSHNSNFAIVSICCFLFVMTSCFFL